MGNCLSVKTPEKKEPVLSSSTSESAKKNKSVSEYKSTKSSESEEKKVYKMLLVGPGEAGKSTFFKIVTNKMSSMYTSETDLVEFKESIHENIIESMKTLINKCNELKEYTDDEGDTFDCRISELLEDEVELVLGIDSDELESASMEAIKKLIADDGLSTCLTKLRHLYYIPDGAPYFFEHLDRIGRDDYVPTFTDILNCRDRTTGVTHEELPYDYEGKQVIVDLYDVGGQRAERKAWKKVFYKVSMIAFFIAISEFDMTCIEDDVTFRLSESLTVLKVLNQSPNFKNTPIMLLVTKIDQLEKKLAKGRRFFLEPPEKGVITFARYEGDNTIEDIKEYILGLCKSQINGDKTVVPAFKNLVGSDVSFKEEFDQLIAAANANEQ